MEGRGVSDLVAPPVEQVVRHREEEREEHGVRQVEWQRQRVRCFWGGRFVWLLAAEGPAVVHGGGERPLWRLRGPPADIHFIHRLRKTK